MTKLVNKTVLIDDSDIDLFIQRRFLEVYNFSNHLVLYKSAEEALHWLREIDPEKAPDVIFIDLNMPESDGFAFLKSFAELPNQLSNKTKIVVLTSSNNPNDRDIAFSYPNVVQFITKPLKKGDIETLKQMLSSNRA
jgi:two-component system nitrate/nitrite response regulator NarL